MGKEGRQAVRCSDFAFARFRFLRRVLLVHGHWYYWRVSTLVQYFFYKNITFITPAVFFAIFSAYSTQVCHWYLLCISCLHDLTLDFICSRFMIRFSWRFTTSFLHRGLFWFLVFSSKTLPHVNCSKISISTGTLRTTLVWVGFSFSSGHY
jgi:magnesium-transporting ATPase (P-type)